VAFAPEKLVFEPLQIPGCFYRITG